MRKIAKNEEKEKDAIISILVPAMNRMIKAGGNDREWVEYVIFSIIGSVILEGHGEKRLKRYFKEIFEHANLNYGDFSAAPEVLKALKAVQNWLGPSGNEEEERIGLIIDMAISKAEGTEK